MFGKKKKQEEIKTEETQAPTQGEKVSFDSNSKSIFEKNRKTLKDFIAPEHIDFTTSHKYASLGDKYLMKNLYVGILPNSANFASFLHNLYNFGNIDTSIFINPIDSESAKAELSKLRTNLEMEYYGSNGSSNRSDDMASKTMEAQKLRAEVRDGLNKIFEVSILATYFDTDERNLNNGVDVLKELLGQSDIGLKSATYIQEEAFRSNKPLNTNHIGEWHTFDKRSLACVFPFTQNNINHVNGVLFGFNMDNSLPVFYDTFDPSLDNYNLVCFSKSGGGKSTTIKMLSARSAILDNIQTISIDIEPEYREIAETLGGINITIAPESSTVINPFDIAIDIIENEVTGKEEETILLNDKINSVTAILMTMAKGTLGNSPYYDDIARMIIKGLVKGEYKRIGITENPESLYTYKKENIEEGRLVGGKVKKEIPTISSWFTALKAEAEENTNATYQGYYDYLLKVMSDYAKSEEGSFTCFDGQSTVTLSYDVPFINFDVSRLNENSELPIAQHIITDYIWEQMVKRNTTGHKMRVIIDEAWRMIKLPEALEFLITMFRRARKKNTSTVVISQQFDEFYREETSPIIKNADTKLFLKPDKSSIQQIKEVFKLTEGEAEFLKTNQRGEGLLIVNNVSAKVRIDIPELEIDFIETNLNKKAEKKKAKVG